MCPFNLPLSAPACYWIPFRLSKHRLSNSLSQHQSNSQAVAILEGTNLGGTAGPRKKVGGQDKCLSCMVIFRCNENLFGMNIDRRSTIYSWLLSDARTPVWFSR